MSASNIINVKTDLALGVQKHRLGRLFAANDKLAHTINVTVLQDGAAADLSGQTITAYFIRQDEATVTVNGTLSGNVATVNLPSACYAKPGYFSLIIKASGDVSTAIFWADGTITRTSTDIIVDPEHIVPSLEELLAQISVMQTATAAANTAAGTANTAAGNADTKAGLADTAAATANAAAAKIDNMTVSASGLAAGESPAATITEVSGHKHIAFAIPKGDKGEKGDKGDPGSIDNVSAETIPMSATDSTTVAQAIAAAGKVETVAGVGVASGTKNVPLTGADLPVSSSDATKVSAKLSGIEANVSANAQDISDLQTTASELRILKITFSSFSSLPQTVSNAAITTDMVCLKAELGTPSAQTGDWTVNTDTAGQVTVSGSISGSTTLTLYLAKSR